MTLIFAILINLSVSQSMTLECPKPPTHLMLNREVAVAGLSYHLLKWQLATRHQNLNLNLDLNPNPKSELNLNLKSGSDSWSQSQSKI